MHTAISIVALATLGAVVAGGCGGAAAPGPTAAAKPTLGTDGGPSPAASAPVANSVVVATVMDVTIGSGPDTGSHHASSSSVTCTYGLSALGEDAAHSLGNQFADDTSAGLSALELIVPDARQAAKGGTDAFVLSVRIGRPARAHKYRINSLPARYDVGPVEGSGVLELDDGGAVGVVSVRGRTGDGIPIDARIQCNRILDADGQPRE